MGTDNSRLEKQIQFIIEIDKLKKIVRQTLLTDHSRKENDAEHSWHIALMSVLLSEYAQEKGIDLLHVVTMLLVHDLVEIDAGDTFCYDQKGNADKLERETKAADRIFNILPEDQAASFRSLWDEFEAGKTAEARFAAAMDRLQPLLHNYNTEGGTWKEHRILKDQVIIRNNAIEKGSSTLWAFAAQLIDDAVDKGFLMTNVPEPCTRVVHDD
ncbi:MAG: HD domain-containing protein [Deltaproteobacteria bacterium]|nr:HD domain-containing protein [Deltaproteobacteria bacterium]